MSIHPMPLALLLAVSAALPNAARAQEAAPAGTTPAWMDRSQSPDARAKAWVQALTEDEKYRLLRTEFGFDSNKGKQPQGSYGAAGYMPPIPRVGIPAIQESDAGQGTAHPGASGTGSTALPAMLGVAASWDPAIARAGGEMIGRQARQKGFNVLLAGGVNLVRDPRNGRNFEYAGEDPLLAGAIVGNAIAGVQSNHVVSTLKHFAINDLETHRNFHSADIDETALRESDLRAFKIAYDIGQPGAVMSAYNKVNGTYAGEHAWLLTTVLKGEWKFPGYVMSDWGGAHTAAKAALAGLDQQSAGEVFDKQVWFDKPLRAAVAKGEVPQARIDDMAQRVLRTLIAHGDVDYPISVPQTVDFEGDGRVSRDAAEAGAVLLRNQGALLPLSNSIKAIAVIGAHADAGVWSGGGSSMVRPPEGNAVPDLEPTGWPGPVMILPDSPLKALREAAPNTEITYNDGKDPAAAAALAANSEVVIVVAQQWAAESLDTPSMTLSDHQDALIEAVAKANPRTVVVLQAGNPVRLPWLSQVQSVLQVWFPGSRGGQAIARLLTGQAEPGGRLPLSWPQNESQLPRPVIVGSGAGNKTTPDLNIDYNIEGADVGYRWFAREGYRPLFPFGYGLGYTRFRYANLKVSQDGTQLVAELDVTNTGARAGHAVPQLYANAPDGSPLRLIGFDKLELQPGASQHVRIAIPAERLARYDASAKAWKVAAGTYKVWLGSDAATPLEAITLALPAQTLE
ncbi:beta-glucosidase [Pseudoxanthomonas sp. GM95]|uniref:beta-glucosidase family protein n=1 Tax=Pseudoxanthomonas sp. GM95 TaxID=1881043 RepID=UPI0008C07D18|nr:glycoside hydrolase family 3 protein [Pseudoxanthomonas sp. GM95]SEL86113.1 beta-glucosidase [Pseudoxanthomonas sp. GM95]